MPRVDPQHPHRPITIVFDTDCVLCSAWVRFLLKHERGDVFQFASSRKPVGLGLARDNGLSPEDLDLTYLVLRDGAALTKSDAGLALFAALKAPWPLLRVLRFVPRGVRDWIYDIVARNRLNWFGQKTDCLLPSPAQRDKFLDALPDLGQAPARTQ